MAEQTRREAILLAADRLFRHYGPQKTTMADIAREASIGVGSVYLEFPSKDAVIEALSRGRYAAVVAAMRSAATAPGASCAERLSRVFEARTRGFLAMLEDGAHACDLLHCGSDAVKSAKTAYHEEERRILTELLREGVACGELTVAEVDATVRVLLLACSRFEPPWIAHAPTDSVLADVAAMTTLLLTGLLKRTG
ncbi:MAG: TetR/AcrR family transcriptional regulator [Polyangiaceae bacterium]